MTTRDAGAEELTLLWARFGAELTYDDLPESVRRTVRSVALDTFATTLAANTLGIGIQQLLTWARRAGGTEEASLIGLPDRLPAAVAAMLNGGMAHALNFDDSTAVGSGHLGPVTLPTALVAAELRGGRFRQRLHDRARGGDGVDVENRHRHHRHAGRIHGIEAAADADAGLLRRGDERVEHARLLAAGDAQRARPRVHAGVRGATARAGGTSCEGDLCRLLLSGRDAECAPGTRGAVGRLRRIRGRGRLLPHLLWRRVSPPRDE